MRKFVVLLIFVLCFGEINWEIEIVDSFAAPHRGCDLTLDSAQVPHIIYTKNAKIIHAVRCDTGWRKEIVESGFIYYRCTAVFDKNNNEHIGYYRKDDNIRQTYLCYAIYNGNIWNLQVIDSIGTIPISSAIDVDIDSLSNPGIAYVSFNPDDSVSFIKYAHFDSSNWNISVVEYDTGCGSISQPSDQYPNLKFNSQDIPHIAYHHIVDQTDTIKLAYWSDSLNRWLKDTVYNHAYGCAPISFAINKRDEPYIAHGVDVGLYCSSRHNGIWYHDYTGIDIGWLNTTFSLALDSLSNPHIIYTVMGSGPRYLFRDSIWHDVGYVDTINSRVYKLAIDRNGCLHLAYAGFSTEGLRYARGTFVGIEESHTGVRIQGLKMKIIPSISYGALNIEYSLKNEGAVMIEIYDISGAKRKSIKLAHCQPGHYQKTMNLADLASGVYFLVLKQHDVQASEKFLLTR